MKNSKLIEGVHYAELDKLSFDQLADKYAPAQNILMKQKALIKNNPELSKDALSAYQYYCDLLEEAIYKELDKRIPSFFWKMVMEDKENQFSVVV